ncbi:MAG: hypothetical protein JEZ12_02250 [Desulfobacterium sp.]|nr:hypothetical protein [Desulfobacterium sp.]
MSNNILDFSMNRCTSVRAIDTTRLKSECTLRDSFTDARVEIIVAMPDLTISSVTGHFHHAWLRESDTLGPVFDKLVDVRVGPGMLKIIKGLVGEAEHLKELTYMVEECCHGVILSLTKKVLLKAPDDEAAKADFYSNMVMESIRLYDRCAAFAKGTPLVEGYERRNP